MKTFYRILLALLAVRIVLMAVVPVFEPSEARYAAISANMARTGDFVVPRFTHECEYQSFDGKPPLVFQAGGLGVLGALCLVPGAEGVGNPYALQFAVRLFPLLSAILLLLILYHTVKRSAVTDDPAEATERAWLSVVICATCTAFYAACGMAMTDMTLTCCVAGALLLYELVMRNEELGTKDGVFPCRAGVAALLGAGMIVKGPVALVTFGLPVLVDAIVNRHWKCIFTWKWLAVAPIFFIIAVPWFVLVEQRNPGAVWYFFYNENFMRFISHDYGDKYGAGREAFRGVSVLWALAATLPWSLCLVPRAWGLVRRWRTHETPITRRLAFVANFDVLAILAIVGFWCLTSRVLIYYLFPMIPLFAAAMAKNFDCRALRRLAPWCAGLSLAVVTAALIGGMVFSPRMRGAATPFELWENHYAHEFYHGTKPTEELQKCRETRKVQWDRLMEKVRTEGVAK